MASRANDVKLSKLLSYVLRHGAGKTESIEIDSSGCVEITKLLELPKFKRFTIEDIRKVVANNDKQRFAIVGDNKIRANQGHSITSIVTEEVLEKITDPSQVPICIHGTYLKYLPAIKTKGLSRMGRNHIHFATSTDSKNGLRSSAEVLIYINVSAAMTNGIEFFRSANGVVLSAGVTGTGLLPPQYFDQVKIL